MKTLQNTKAILLVWVAYRALVAATGYSSGFVVGFILAYATGEEQLATSVGTAVGTVGGLLVDLVIFLMAVRWLGKINRIGQG